MPGGKPEAKQVAWYAIYTRSQQERLVEQGLRAKGYQSFSPFYRTLRRWWDRTKVLDMPLFPSYVFCEMDPNVRLPVLTTPGVVFIVGNGKVPKPIDETEIQSIRAMLNSGLSVQPWQFLKAGHKVRIQAGPLAGAIGRLVRARDRRRLVVSVSLLQRAVSVELDQESVEPIF